jgi:hypothetical protein
MIYTTQIKFSRMVGNASRSFGWRVTAHEDTGGGDNMHVVFHYQTPTGGVAINTELMAAVDYFELCDNLANDPRTARQHLETLLIDSDDLIFDEVSGDLMTRDEYSEARDECAEMVRHERAESRPDIFV